MKKNFIFGLFALVTMLFTASCAEEQLVPNSAGDTATVSFEVSTPTLATRAVGDGTTATKLYVGVYENQNGTLAGPLDVSLIGDNETVTFTDRVATVNLALAKNKEYSVIFWAETADNGEAMFNIDWENRQLTLKSEVIANQEKYDAFWAQKTVTITGAISEKVNLKRPFAQLNIGTSDKAEAEAAGIVVNRTEVTTKVFTSFSLQDGKASDEKEITFSMSSIEGIKDATFPAVTTPEQKYLSLNYLLMNEDKSIVDVKFSYMDVEDDKTYDLPFTSVPVQRNYRTNIYGTLLTNSANYTVEILPGFGENGEQDAANVVYATTADDVMKALAANEEKIKIVLLNDITLDGGTGTEYGTGVTKEIIIEGNSTATRGGNAEKFTLTYKDGYRTYVKMANAEGKLVFKNLNLCRNTTSTNTHWHDNNMKFCCNTEFENVDFNKGICFDDAKTFVMNNCSINKSKVATYALFITAGCNVTIDGLAVTHSDGVAGRGIKIVDEDVANKQALTILSVSNSSFVTESKAAIMVGSQGGAKISLANNDLSGVKADGFNAVWVDEDYKDYAQNVGIEGGFCKIEGTQDNAESNPFLVENGTVNIPSGHFVMPTRVANGLTIVGATDGTTVLDMTGANPSGVSGLTFQNVTLNVSTNLYHGIQHSSGLAYNNCVINGTLWLYSTASFTDCTFNVEGDAYNVWTYGSTEATFTGCTFNCDGKSVLVYNEGGNGSVVTMNQCSFVARKAVDGKAAVEIDSSLLPEGKQFVVNLNGCSAEGFGRGSVSNNMLFNHKNGSKASVFVNGTKAVSTITELNAATESEIYLAGKFTGDAILAKSGKTYLGYDGGVVGCINLNGADNVTLSGIKFDAQYAKLGYDDLGNAKQYANIITGDNVNKPNKGSHNLVINDCTFEGTYAQGGAAIAFTDQGRGEGGSGNITIMGCTFKTENAYYNIYAHYTGDGLNGHGDFKIEGNTFKTTFTQGLPVYLGRYATSTPVVVTGNAFETVADLENAVYVQDHSNYGVSVDASDNTFGKQ